MRIVIELDTNKLDKANKKAREIEQILVHFNVKYACIDVEE